MKNENFSVSLAISCQTCQILADFTSLAKYLSQLKQGYYYNHLGVCLSAWEKIN